MLHSLMAPGKQGPADYYYYCYNYINNYCFFKWGSHVLRVPSNCVVKRWGTHVLRVLV
jgi:hypothetical protein